MNNNTSSPSASTGSGIYLASICVVASLGGLLFGFDTAVISGTVERVTGQFGLSNIQQGWFTSAALVGCVAGALGAGSLGDRFGRKPNLIVAAVLFFISAFFSAFPPDFSGLIVARIIGGIGVGMASVLGPMYISELAPPKMRGRLVACYQLSIVLGILFAYLSNLVIVRYGQSHPIAFGGEGMIHKIFVSEMWRAMFGAEMLPALLFFLLLFFVPESPRWLIEKGRVDEGLNKLTRISGSDVAQREVAEIQDSLSQHEAGKLAELFRPGLRIALIVGVMLSVFGQVSGVNIVVYYGPKILAAAGFAEVATLLGQVGFGLINLVFTVLAMLFIDRFGRRPLLIGGMAVVTIALTIIGGLFLSVGAESALAAGDGGEISRTTGIWIGVMICVYVAAIAFSICAVIWVITPEIFPNRVRGRAVSLCTFANWSVNAFSAFAFPWYVASFGMHTGFFTSAAICLVATLFFWRFVPETKGKSLEQIEKLWGRDGAGIARKHAGNIDHPI